MYYKIIGDRTVFSTCKTIELDGRWISNPSEEQIFSAGWQFYVPPVVPPQPETEPDYGDVLAAVKKMFSTETDELSDEDALDVAALFPTFVSKIGQPVPAGERLWWDGRLWKAIQNISELLANWTPDISPSLFVEVSIEEIPEWVQPISAETAYHLGDKVRYNDKIWESVVDNNTWAPGVYGWNEL